MRFFWVYLLVKNWLQNSSHKKRCFFEVFWSTKLTASFSQATHNFFSSLFFFPKATTVGQTVVKIIEFSKMWLFCCYLCTAMCNDLHFGSSLKLYFFTPHYCKKVNFFTFDVYLQSEISITLPNAWLLYTINESKFNNFSNMSIVYWLHSYPVDDMPYRRWKCFCFTNYWFYSTPSIWGSRAKDAVFNAHCLTYIKETSLACGGAQKGQNYDF